MKKRTRDIIAAFMTILSVWQFTSCAKVFPNDKLDFLWRLDKVCYLHSGTSNNEMEKSGIWYAFARDLVEIRNGETNGPIGILTDYGDSIKIDYSMYCEVAEYDIDSLLRYLSNCGITSLTTVFKIEQLDCNMILSNNDTRLFFTKW